MTKLKKIILKLISNYYVGKIHEKVIKDFEKDSNVATFDDEKYTSLMEYIEDQFKDDLLFYIYMHLRYQYNRDIPDFLNLEKISDMGQILLILENYEQRHIKKLY